MDETNDCAKDLPEQDWYWGNATKEDITNAISVRKILLE